MININIRIYLKFVIVIDLYYSGFYRNVCICVVKTQNFLIFSAKEFASFVHLLINTLVP